MLVGYPTREQWLFEYNEPGTRKILDASLKHFDKFLDKIEKKRIRIF